MNYYWKSEQLCFHSCPLCLLLSLIDVVAAVEVVRDGAAVGAGLILVTDAEGTGGGCCLPFWA